MTATRRFFIFAVLFLLPVVASAATTEFRVLIDSDNNAATGCATGGMTGIDHVLVTRVQTDATSGAVDQSYRLTCSGGSTFSAPIDMTAGGWSVGFNPANGGMLVENRLAFSVLTNAAMPTNMRLGFVATTSGASHGATAHANGSPVIYPVTNGRRHSVGAPGSPRVFQLDGNGNDWNGLNPLVNGIASGGSPAIRMIQVYAFANPHDSFIYFRFDAHVGSDAPFAEDDEYERPAGQDLTVPAPGVLANDGDPNGQPLTALPVSDAAHGDVTLNADGSFTYQPNDPASSQTDSFQYKASNGTQESNVAKVTITVSAVVDTTPVANDDSYPGTEDTPLSVPAPGVLANDSDADGDDITATKLTDPSNGTVVVNDNGSFTYTPNENFFGTDTFTYTVSDGTNTATATVTITVESINDAPVVEDAAFSIDENTPAGTLVGNVSGSDVEGDSLSYAITGGNTNGAFAINNSGAITVSNQSALDFETTPSFSLTITVTDSGVPGESGTGTVTITINDVNEAPLAVDDATSIAEDGSANVVAPGLLANDSDPDGDSITASKVSDPANGVATVAANGGWTYTPNANFNGTDSFTYRVNDGSLDSNVATVTIVVTAVNDPPSFTSGGNVSGDEDTPFSAPWATAISAGPADEAGQTLTFNVTNDDNAAFSVQPAISSTGVLTFTPALNVTGPVNVSVTLSDNGGGANTSGTQNFVITIREANDLPVATNDARTTPEDTPLVFAASTLTGNDAAGPANESGQTLTVTGVSATSAQGGTVVLAAGNITYTPPANYNGPDSFTYTVTDNGTTAGAADPQSANGTVNVTVTEVNDAPAANADAANASEDTPLIFAAATLTTNDSTGPANESAQTLTVTGVSATSAQGGTVTLSAGNITYTPPVNYFGADSFTYTVSDNGTTNGAADPLTANGTVNVTVAAVNDVPVLTVTGAVTHTEAGAATNLATAASIVDIDDTNIEGATIAITGNYAGAEDVLSFVNTPNITGNVVGNTLTLTGTDTIANYIAALQAVQYTNTSDVPSTLQRSITWTVNDGDGNSNAQVTTLDVVASNDAPVNAVPGGQTVAEDTPLTFSTSNGNAISISDIDAAADDVQVTLNVTNGTVTLNGAATGALTSLTGDGTGTVVATGTVAEINAALDGMTFTAIANYNGAAAIQIVTDDLGNNPSGALTDTDSVSITVTAVNDASVLTVTGAVTHTEGGAATNLATAVNITDLDDTNIESATIQITGNYAGAEDVLSFVNTPNITGNVVGDTLTLTGSDTIANYIAALQAVQYTNTSDVPSTLQRTITWTVNDGDNVSNSQTTTLDVTATNDAPVNAIPAAAQSTNEDTPLTLSGANALSISDVDAASDDVQVTLNVTNGTVALDPTATGALTSLTGDGTATVVATGTVAEINAALDGMVFTPTADSNLMGTIQIVTDDLGNNPSGALTDTDSLNITVNPVNDVPVLSVTGAVTHTEAGAATQIATAATINDLDDTNIESATIVISANFATGDTLAFVNTPNITGAFVGNTLTLTGTDTEANYAAALQAITFSTTSDTPSTLQRTITWTVNDGDGNSNTQTTTVDVTATNDAPVNAMPGAQSTDEDTPLTMSGANAISISDVDAASDDVQVTLNVTNGTVALDPTATAALTTLTGDGTATVVATGTVAEINAALDGMVFTPTTDSNLMGTIQIVTDDLGNNPSGALTDTDSVNITVNPVNDVPVLTVTGAVTHTEAGAATNVATAANITDLDDTNIEGATIAITGNYAAEDVLSFVNTPNITGNVVGNTLTLTGTDTIANYIAALQAVQYTNTSDAPSTLQRTISWTVTDGDGNSNTQTTTVDVTATNDAPVNAMPGAQSTDEDTPLTMSGANAISISDVDAASDDVQVTLNVTNGTVALDPTATAALTTLTGDGTATVVATGTVAEINAALDGMTFTPTLDSNATGTIQIVTDDLGNNPSGALTDTDSVNITVNAVNDVPVLTVTGAVTHTEAGAATNLATAANITDLDDTNIEGATIAITGNYAGAEDVLSFVNTPNITGNVVGNTLTLTGTDTLANYIAALQAVQYTNTSDAPSTLQRTISWTVNDGDGNSNTQTTTLDITATNDAPVNAIPGGAQSTTEDIPLTLSGVNAISISDPDAASDDVQVTLNVTNGTVALDPTATAALTSLTGDGTATVVATGTVAEINAALDGMTFTPTLDSNAMGTIQIVTDDLGNNPSGALTDTDSLNITVNAANDAPVLTVTGTPTFAENGSAVAIAATVNITDVDDTNIESAAITITNAQTGDVLNFINTANITGNFAAGVLTLTGSDTEANYIAALQSITFSNASDNPSIVQRNLTWTVNDGDVDSNVQNTTLDVTATNDAPQNTVAVGVATNEDTPVVINGASIADPDADPDDVQITLNVTSGTVALDPTATGVLTSLTGDGTATVVATGTVAEINDALAGMTFTPSLDFSGTASIQMVVDDLGNNPSGALTDTDSFNITVNNVNDAPVLTVTGTPTFAENGSAVAIAATVNITDVDDTNIESATITITNVQAGDVLNFINTANITGNYAAGVLMLTGSDTEANYIAALQSITFSNASDNPSITQRTISWVVNDGDVDSNTQNTTLDVTATNDGPVNTVAVGVTTDEDTPVVINGASIADADADPDDVQITLNVTGGTVALDPTATGALASLTGDGTATVVATGTVAEINAALSGMTFSPTADSNLNTVAAAIQMVTDDLGNNPSGALTDTDSFGITVNPVNDMPSYTPGTDITVPEDAGNVISPNWAMNRSKGPADENGQVLTFNVAVTNITGNLVFSAVPAIGGTNGTLTFTANGNTCGTATIDITLSDDAGTPGVPGDDLTTGIVTKLLTIQCVNDDPSFTKGPDQTVDEDAGAQTINPWATGISPGPNESDLLTFNVSNNNNALFTAGGQPAVSPTGVLTYTPAPNANGTAIVSVTLTDDGSTPGVPGDDITTSPAQTFNITVNAVNDAPSFTLPGDPAFVVLGAGAQTVSAYATSINDGDPELTQVLTFNISQTGSTGTLGFDVAPAIDPTSGDLTYTPTAGTHGTVTFSVTLSDDGSNTAPNVNISGAQSFTIAVEKAPEVVPPTVPADNATGVSTSTNITVNFDEPVSVTLVPATFKINCNAGPDLGFAYVGGTTNVTTVTLDPTNPLPAGNCVVTVVAAEVHDTDAYDPPDGLAVDYVFDFVTNTPPTAVDDNTTALGHVTLTVPDADGVLVNGTDGAGADTDPDAGAVLTIQNPGTPITTTQGGTITFTAGGGYTYNSQAMDQNITDTVDYVVTDQFGGTDTGTLSINLGPRFIYVDDNHPTVTPDGRDIHPWKTMQQAQANSAANDTILVMAGTYNDHIVLQAGQRLIGQGIAANHVVTHNTVNFTVLTMGASPSIARAAAGDTITLGANNIIRGVTIGAAAGRGVVGNAFTAVTITEAAVSATGGAALDLTTGTATITLASTSSTNSAGTGVNLVGINGTVDLGTGTISNPTGIGFNASGGLATITYAGNVSAGGAGAVVIASRAAGANNVTLSGTITGSVNGIGINVNNVAAGTVTFSGAKTLTTGANAGVSLATNTNGTVVFSGGALVINTISGTGFTATGGGTVTVLGAANTITTTGAAVAALSLNGVTMAAGNGVTFNSVAAAATTVTGVSLTGLLGTGGVTINGGTNSAVTGLSMTTMGTVPTAINNVTFNNGGDAIAGTNFNTLTVSNVAVTAALHAFVLNTGNVNGTFTSVNCTPAGNNVPVTLTSVGGSFTVSGGAIGSGGGGSTPDVFVVTGGNVAFTWNGTMNQAKAGALINITNHSTGLMTFGSTLTANTGSGLQFTNADGNYQFTGAATLSGTAGIDILAGTDAVNGSQGTFNWDADSSIAATTGQIIDIQGSKPTFTYSGTFTKNNTGNGINALNNQGGSITLNGTTKTITTTNAGAHAINLDNNDNCVIAISGNNLLLTTTTGDGLRAINGGTITLTGTGNIATSVGGAAVNIANTFIGSAGVTFRQVNANGGTNGIIVNNVGTTLGTHGGFSITGNSGAGTGGTIQNTGVGITATSTRDLSLNWMTFTNANTTDGGGAGACDSGTVTGCNGAVKMTTVTNATLTQMTMTGTMADNGIFGNGVRNLDISNVTITNAGDNVNEHGIRVSDLFGTTAASQNSVWSNISITNAAGHNIFVQTNSATNAFPGAADELTITNSTFTNPGSAGQSDQITIAGRNAANIKNTLSNNTFNSTRVCTDAIQVDAGNTSHSDVILTSNTFNVAYTVGTTVVNGCNTAMNVSGANTSVTTFSITNNPVVMAGVGTAINIASNGSSTLTGTISGHTNITVPAGLKDGTSNATNLENNGMGIDMVVDQQGTITALVDGNTVNDLSTGVRGVARNSGTGRLNLTLSNNTFDSGGIFELYPVYLASGNGSGSETNEVCVNFNNNQTVTGIPGNSHYWIEQWGGAGSSNKFNIQGLTPTTGASEAQIEAYVSSKDIGGATVEVNTTGVIAYTGTGVCSTP